jgi:hypothetical protein
MVSSRKVVAYHEQISGQRCKSLNCKKASNSMWYFLQYAVKNGDASADVCLLKPGHVQQSPPTGGSTSVFAVAPEFAP